MNAVIMVCNCGHKWMAERAYFECPACNGIDFGVERISDESNANKSLQIAVDLLRLMEKQEIQMRSFPASALRDLLVSHSALILRFQATLTDSINHTVGKQLWKQER